MGKSFTSGGCSMIFIDFHGHDVMFDYQNTFRRSLNACKAPVRPITELRAAPGWYARSMRSRAFTSIEIFISCGTLPNTCFITRLSKDPEEARFFKRGNSAPLTATEQHLGLKSSHGTSKSFDINNLSTTMWNSLTNKNNIKRLSKMF
jgi:hypothetical protein